MQLFARNGNYDEGFGLENYKRKWLQRSNETAAAALWSSQPNNSNFYLNESINVFYINI